MHPTLNVMHRTIGFWVWELLQNTKNPFLESSRSNQKKFNVPLKAHFSDCFTGCNFSLYIQGQKHFFLVSLYKSTNYNMNALTFIFNKVYLKRAVDITLIFYPNGYTHSLLFPNRFFTCCARFFKIFWMWFVFWKYDCSYGYEIRVRVVPLRFSVWQ